MTKHTSPKEILQDLRPDGTERPWREKKMKTLVLTSSFRRLDEQPRAERICTCGSFLEFKETVETNERKLTRANFCRERLCPMCAWRRSLRGAHVLSTVMNHVETAHGLVPLFLTLTIKNCPATVADLKQSLDVVFQGWNRLTRVKRVKNAVNGWFRALEVTYNSEADTFHPHLHAIVYVDKSYFGRNYIKTSEWVRLWRQSCRLDYDPVCHIERARKGPNELSKYTVKDNDYLMPDGKLMDKLVYALHKALRLRRLIAFGGILKQIAKELKILDDDGKEDLIQIGDTIREDIETRIVRYFFHYGVCQYLKSKEKT